MICKREKGVLSSPISYTKVIPTIMKSILQLDTTNNITPSPKTSQHTFIIVVTSFYQGFLVKAYKKKSLEGSSFHNYYDL